MTIGRTWLGPQCKATLTTVDATADQVLLEVPIPFKHTSQVAVYVMATDGTDTLYEASLQAALRDGATATYSGELAADALVSAGFGACAVGYDCSGVNLRIKVTGIAGKTIKWFAVAVFEDSAVNVPIIAEWATNDLSQSHTIRVTNTVPYWIDWGDGSFDAGIGDGANQAIVHNYAAAGWYHQRWMIAAKANLLRVYHNSNGIKLGAIDFASCTGLTHVTIDTNPMSAQLPDANAASGMQYFTAYSCDLTGAIFSVSLMPGLLWLYLYSNSLSGTIPSLTANVALIRVYVHSNRLTGYTASTIAATCTIFRAENNLLPESAVDQIMADFLVGAAGRPAAGTIALGGTGNAPLSAAGLASKAAFLAIQPAWTITHN